jgi:hypothetical protein
MILSKPTYPYLRGINETVLAGAINIPANVFASHLTFGKATLYIGVTGSVNYTKGTTINWDIERQTMFRPRKSN